MDTTTKIIKIDSKNIDPEGIEEATKVIRSGGLVAFPTETVYGLGADATKKEAARKIYSAKGRPSDNPLIVHINDIEMAKSVVEEWTDEAELLANAFWPGPLTIILKKGDVIPYETTGGLETVALRMPSNPIALKFIAKSNTPIAAPSANISGRPSPTKISHVIEDMEGRIDLIIDGGDVKLGLESTIVDLSVEPPAILRKGFITTKEIRDTLGSEIISPDIKVPDDTSPKAPGMKYKHYAPKGEIYIVKKEGDAASKQIISLVNKARKTRKKIAVICAAETESAYQNQGIYTYCLGSRQDGEAIASNLYDVLHRMDSENIELSYSENFYDVKLGDAIMERLEKAAGHKFI